MVVFGQRIVEISSCGHGGCPPGRARCLRSTLGTKTHQPLQTGTSGAYPCLGLDFSFTAHRARSLGKTPWSVLGLYVKGVGRFQVVVVGISQIIG